MAWNFQLNELDFGIFQLFPDVFPQFLQLFQWFLLQFDLCDLDFRLLWVFGRFPLELELFRLEELRERVSFGVKHVVWQRFVLEFEVRFCIGFELYWCVNLVFAHSEASNDCVKCAVDQLEIY